MRYNLHSLFLGLVWLGLLVGSSCTGHSDKGERAETDSAKMGTTVEDDQKTRPSHPLDFKLYMERSGSMVSFDSNDSKGDFKKIVSTLLNRFPKVNSNDSTSVYIVNDDIYPYEGTVKDFLAQRDFFTSTKGIGNPSYTDFDKIFEMILVDTRKYQVSALVTDLIYSTNGQETTTADKLLNEAYALTHNVFKGKTSTSVIVVQFEANYNGPYYPYNSPGKGLHYSGERPFYVLLFASEDSMHELFNTQAYTSFTNFSDISGYRNMFTFTDLKFTIPYSIIMDYSHDGSYRKGKNSREARAKGEDRKVTGIENAKLGKTSNNIEIPIALDLTSIPLSNEYKKNKANYEITSDAGYIIKSIDTVDSLEDSQVNEIKETLPSATHLLVLETKKPLQNESVSVRMRYALPGWIEKSSSSDDSNLTEDNFDVTTFGLEEVMNGIFNAYVPHGSSRYLFDFSIDIKKK